MKTNKSSTSLTVGTNYSYDISSCTTVTISFNNSASNESGGWQSVVKEGRISSITLS